MRAGRGGETARRDRVAFRPMLATLLIFAQETAEEEPNKVPFYILGGAAAVWAIFLFAVGMRTPSFPGSVGAQRGVMAISVVLVAATMASAVLTA
jgi:hypothetical protein